MVKLASLVSVSAVVLSVCPIAAAQDDAALKHTFSIGSYFSEGDYGETVDTRIRYYPMSYQFQSGSWGFQLTVPHLEINGLGNVLVNVGGVTRAAAADEKVSSSGLGDTVATLTYQFATERQNGPFFDLVLEAKIPTADEDKGLGTGEYDYGLQLDIFQPWGSATLFGTLGYKFRGRSDLFTGLQDSAFVELGVSMPVSETVSAGLIYDFNEPASDYSKEIHEFLPFLSWQISPNWTVMGYAAWGLTEDSPDYAVGAQLSFRW